MRASRRAATFFPPAASYPFCWGLRAWQGEQVELGRDLGHEGAMQVGEIGEREGEGNKRKRESCWKSGRGRVRLYT
jgi:hypothetical protein